MWHFQRLCHQEKQTLISEKWNFIFVQRPSSFSSKVKRQLETVSFCKVVLQHFLNLWSPFEDKHRRAGTVTLTIKSSTWFIEPSLLSLWTAEEKVNSWKKRRVSKTTNPLPNQNWFVLFKDDIQYEQWLIKRNDIQNYVISVFVVVALCWYYLTTRA